MHNVLCNCRKIIAETTKFKREGVVQKRVGPQTRKEEVSARSILTFEYVPFNEFLCGGPHGQAADEARADGLPRLLSLVLTLHHQNVPARTSRIITTVSSIYVNVHLHALM